MSAGIPPIHSTPTPIPTLASPPKTETIDLEKELQIFIQEAPDIEENLNDAQLKTAKKLKHGILELYTPEKLYQLYQVQHQEFKDEDLSPPEIFRRLNSISPTRHAGLALQCWEKRESETGILQFLKDIIDTKEILWVPAPALHSTGIEALHANVVLHILLGKEIDVEILEKINSNLKQSELKQHIENEKRIIETMKQEIYPLSHSVAGHSIAGIDKLETEEVESLIIEKKLDQRIGLLVLAYKHKTLAIEKKKEAVELLEALNFFLLCGEIETPKKALEGAEKYLDYLVDEEKKKKKPEGNPEEALINRLLEIQARGF